MGAAGAGAGRRESPEENGGRGTPGAGGTLPPSALPGPEPARREPPQPPAATHRFAGRRGTLRAAGPPRSAAAAAGRRPACGARDPRGAERGGPGRGGRGRFPGLSRPLALGPLGPSPREAAEPRGANSCPLFFRLLFWLVFSFPRCARRISRGARRGAAAHRSPSARLLRDRSALLPSPISPGREERCCAHSQLQASAPTAFLWAHPASADPRLIRL